VLEKTIRRPSGETSGALSSTPAAVRVMRVTAVPSHRIRKISTLSYDTRSLVKKMNPPPGDQEGVWSVTCRAVRVSRTCALPSARIR
jgi:hypothetical protein